MCNLQWTPPLLAKDNSKNNVLAVSEEELMKKKKSQIANYCWVPLND